MTDVQEKIIRCLMLLFENDQRFGQIVSNIFFESDPFYISDEISLKKLEQLARQLDCKMKKEN